jgi:hypothetical protein
MWELHAPARIEGSLDEMSVSEFHGANRAACRGAGRQGGVGPPLVRSTLTERDEFHADAIANGRPGTSMPAWSQLGLGRDDVATLITFLRTEPRRSRGVSEPPYRNVCERAEACRSAPAQSRA